LHLSFVALAHRRARAVEKPNKYLPPVRGRSKALCAIEEVFSLFGFGASPEGVPEGGDISDKITRMTGM
jgi:hypothetical protein